MKWIEGWYDKDVEVGDGLFRKERTCGYAYWAPHAHAFNPTHWMPVPDPPVADPEPETSRSAESEGA